MAKRVAIYARVSTTEGRQDPETQLRDLREYAERRGFELVGEGEHTTLVSSRQTSWLGESLGCRQRADLRDKGVELKQ